MLSRRRAMTVSAGGSAALTLGAPAAHAQPAPHRPFGPPAHRLNLRTPDIDQRGRGDHTDVQSAVDAVSAGGYTLVLAGGTYRGTVAIDADGAGPTLTGASGDPRDTVVVHNNAAGTPGPDGSGTYGAGVTVPANRPRLRASEARSHTQARRLGDWRPYDGRGTAQS